MAHSHPIQKEPVLPAIPADITPEMLNFAEALLTFAEESLKQRAIKVVTAEAPTKSEGLHASVSDVVRKPVFMKAVGTREIERVFQSVREQFECEASEPCS